MDDSQIRAPDAIPLHGPPRRAEAAPSLGLQAPPVANLTSS